MPQGFFSDTQLSVLSSPEPRIPQCGRCGLAQTCRSPKMPVAGKGKKGILIIGEAPGEIEDRQGKPFVGVTGQLLQTELRRCGIELFEDCWVTNALRCRPSNSNEIKDKKSILYCRANALNAIKEYKPVCVILLGNSPLRSVIGHLWREDLGNITRWAGWRIPCQRYNTWICPTFHPSYVKREMEDRGGHPLVLKNFRWHLEGAVAKTKRPWRIVPDYSKEVTILLDPKKAADCIGAFGGEVAFDYETDRLKPDMDDSRIVCCSISDGATTIAYPWHGEAIAATKELLQNPNIAKIASNLKFEERWTRKHLGITVKNWGWDTMLAAHALDSRKGITGLKFQAFVRLGLEDYSVRIKPFLESAEKRGNSKNTIRKANLDDLLVYNCLDSLVEYKIAQLQRKEMGL